MFSKGDEIRTDNGWRFIVDHIIPWSDGETDGAVCARVVAKDGKRSDVRYIGTIQGLAQADPYWRDKR